jgi:hypothetical protein
MHAFLHFLIKLFITKKKLFLEKLDETHLFTSSLLCALTFLQIKFKGSKDEFNQKYFERILKS